MNIYKKITDRKIYWDWILKNRRELKEASKGHQVRFYNWGLLYEQDKWWFDFIEGRGLLKDKPKARIGLYSIFAPFWLSYFDNTDARIFVERENFHRPTGYERFRHHFLEDKRVQLTLGFDEIDHPQYMRMPFWLMWNLFPGTATYEDIKNIIKQVDSPENHSYRKRRFCTFICSHNDEGRERIFKEVNAIAEVDCPGALFHNNDDLKQKYGDNKQRFLKDYRFNLCPENSDTIGYVTEKLPEAIWAGCIPIYQGSEGAPEPNVFNSNAIIFVRLGEDNAEAMKLVSELNCDEKKYMEFACQPRFVGGAAEVIWGYYERLENKLKEIINNV